MIYITNPLLLPLVILVWSADAWLWLASLRLIIGHLTPDNRLCKAIERLTDPLPEYIGRLINKVTGKSLNISFLWIISIVALIVLRHLILGIICTNCC